MTSAALTSFVLLVIVPRDMLVRARRLPHPERVRAVHLRRARAAAGARDARGRAHRGRHACRARRTHRVRRRRPPSATALISTCPVATVIDATDCAVVPGFVDAHTHVVFAGDRRHELRAPAGRRDLRGDCRRGRRHPLDRRRDASRDGRRARRGHVAQARRDAPRRDDDGRGQERLRPDARERADDAAGDRGGSDQAQPIELAPTFMGAHEVPAEYRGPSRGLRRATSSTT